MTISSSSSPSRAADEVISRLRIRDAQDLQDLEKLAWACGAIVCEESLTGTEARVTMHDPHAVITISDSIRNEGRQRFSIAHEVGHVELHSSSSSLSVCSSDEISTTVDESADFPEPELEANRFAGALLMPRTLFGAECRANPPSLELLKSLSERFRTSLTSTAIRFLEFTSEPCAVVVSNNGRISWFRGSDEFRQRNFFVRVNEPLDEYSVAHQLMADTATGEKVAEDEGKVEANAWLASGGHAEDGIICEQSLAMKNYDSVLTLLWVKDEIGGRAFY